MLKVISRSAFDLQAVFNTLINSAVELSGALSGTICLRDGDGYRYARDLLRHAERLRQMALRASADVPTALGGGPRAAVRQGRGSSRHTRGSRLHPAGRDAEQDALGARRAAAAERTGSRACWLLTRTEPGHFTQRQIELVQTFADQAVIAIENVRLFDEVQARTSELSQSLDELRTAQDRLVQTEKLASLGQLTAGIAHEIKNPLNFVNNFSALSIELIDEMLRR